MRRVRIKDDALEQRMFFQRSLFAGGLVTVVAILLVGRAFWLQVVQCPLTQTRAPEQSEVWQHSSQ